MTTSIGIIGGTALAELAALENAEEITVNTPYGAPSGPLLKGRMAGRDVVFLMRHGPGHHLPPHKINYRANIQALRLTGVEQTLAIAAVGGVGDSMSAGRLVIPHQIIDYTWGREHSFSDGVSALQHIDFTEPYDADLRAQLLTAARALDMNVADQAVHAVTQGPRLETAAEVDRLARDGCDIIGMTGMPEAALAREANMKYACCAVVVNAAAGRGEDAIHAEIESTLAQGMSDVGRVLFRVLSAG